MWPEPQATTGLFVDLYHLDAAYVSWRTGQNAPATFDLYTRSAPFGGAYLLTAGLEPALAFVRDFRYTEEDLAYLARIKSYDPAFLDELRRFRFTRRDPGHARGDGRLRRRAAAAGDARPSARRCCWNRVCCGPSASRR